MKMQGKVAVITGAAPGIGLATAEAFANSGAHVVLADIAADKGERAAETIRSRRGSAKFIAMDVTQAASIEAFRGEALARTTGSLCWA